MLERGGVLIPEHVQNLTAVYQTLIDRLNVDVPWRALGKYNFKGNVPFVGGRSIFWSAWSPEPTAAQLRSWPEEVVNALKRDEPNLFKRAIELTGTKPARDIGGPFSLLHREMRRRLFLGLGEIPGSDRYVTEDGLDAPLSVQSTRSQIFRFRKFSSVPILADLLERHGKPGTDARLAATTNTKVCEIAMEDDRRAVGVRILRPDGSSQLLPLRGANLILACGAFEATRLCLKSFGSHANAEQLLGCNLIGHVHSVLTFRIPRQAVLSLPLGLEVSCLLLDGTYHAPAIGRDRATRRFQTQVTAVACVNPEEHAEDIYRWVPDVYGPDLFAVQDSDHVTITLHSLGETTEEWQRRSGARLELNTDPDTGLDLYMPLTPNDLELWEAMDEAADHVVRALARGAKVEYYRGMKGSEPVWTKSLPTRAKRRRKDLVHEAGTTWMGRTADSSVTDLFGRFHHVENVYVVGSGLFPTCGAWNPTLTAVALVDYLVDHLVEAGAAK